MSDKIALSLAGVFVTFVIYAPFVFRDELRVFLLEYMK